MAFANASKKSLIIVKPISTNTFKVKKGNVSEWTCWYMSTQSGCVSGWFCGYNQSQALYAFLKAFLSPEGCNGVDECE